MKRLIRPTVYSILVFATISYTTVMLSLLKSDGDLGMKPVTNIGYPFRYYYQFWLSGSGSPNCGWRIENFIYDALITWGAVLLLYTVANGWKRSFNKAS